MSARRLDGRSIAEAHHAATRESIGTLKQAGIASPSLAVVLVGQNPASLLYVKHKARACAAVGITSHTHTFDDDIAEQTLIDAIDTMNDDPTINGILVQLPLPSHINVSRVLATISPLKDVDGFHPFNVGALCQRTPLLRPCTPAGIMALIASTGVTLRGLEMVIIGASNIVGRPLTLEALLAGCTVTTCHRFTQDLPGQVARADCLVSAVGKPKLIPGDWIKPGAIVIDVGINRLSDGTLCGDIDYESASQRAAWITPVPGGVGPMTVAKLMHNTVQATQLQMQHQPIEALIHGARTVD